MHILKQFAVAIFCDQLISDGIGIIEREDIKRVLLDAHI